MKVLKRMTAVMAAGVLLLVGNIGILPESVTENFAIEVSAAGTIVASGECGAEGDNLTWTLDSEGLLTISGEGEMKNWYNYTDVPWDKNRNNIKSVIIKESITSIGESAFNSCSSINSITILGNVKSIGKGAFASCSSLTSITLPDSLTSIGEWAFHFCDSLTSITIPDGVTNIGNVAFELCRNLTSITIPDSVESIGYHAFSNCTRLTDVYYVGTEGEWNNIYIGNSNECLTDAIIHFNSEMPETETKIVASGECGAEGDNLTWTLDSEGLLTISGEGEMTDWETSTDMPWFFYEWDITAVVIEDGVTSIGNSAFCDFDDALTTITIPDSVTSIGDSAFWDCSALTTITIPDGVTSIGNSAFSYCKGLTTITIPDSVTSIGNSAFSYCIGLTTITIPDSVTSIGDSAFWGCSALTTITIPDGVTSIGNSAFSHCKGLTTITIPDSVTSIGNSAFSYCKVLTTITIPDSVTSIGDSAFSSCSALTTITIPDGVTSIENSAFSYCKGLTTITIPDSVTSIGDGAFYFCDNLTSITIPDSVTSIGGGAFSACYSLTSITIPDSVTSIGDGAFGACGRLTTIEVAEKNENYSSRDGVLFNKDKTTLIQYPKGKDSKEYVIPDSVTSIGDSAFSGCYSLTSITIPDSVTSIGDSALVACGNLTSITIPDSVTSIGDDAFSYCNSLTDVYYSGTEEQWNAIKIGSGNEWLTDAVVHHNYVESVAFGTLNNLKWSLTDEGKLVISGSGPMGLDDTTPAPWLQHTDKIKEVVMEDGVMDIGESAFAGCTNLMSVTISDSAYAIKQGAFKDCKSLTNVVVPVSVSEIQSEAFAGCTALTDIHIPRSLTAIGKDAFYGCVSLKDIYYGGVKDDLPYVSGADLLDSSLKWHYLDEYYYSDVEPKIYEQMRILCDQPTYYGNSQTVDIVNDYRNMAIADPEVESYQFWKNVSKSLSFDLSNFENDFNVKLTTEALIAEIFLNPEINTSLRAAAEQSIEGAQNHLLQFLYDNAGKFELTENEITELEDLLSQDFSSEGFRQGRDEWLSISLERERESQFAEMLSGGIGLLGNAHPELDAICDVCSIVIDVTNLKYKEETQHQYNQQELHQLFISCAAYVGATNEFCRAVEITNKAIKTEMEKYGDDNFGKRMKEAGGHYLHCCEILSDNSGEAYRKYAEKIIYDERFDFFNGGSTSWAATTLTDIVIEEKIKGVQWEGIFKDAKILKDFIKTGVSVWEYFDDVDERSLERDKFMNAILFYDAFSNALYDPQNGFFGELLNNQNELSYKTLVTGIKMHLAAEDMILDYGVNYSRMLKRALKDWNKSILTVNHDRILTIYNARYPDKYTYWQISNSCWKELNADYER